jgi:hypothetical protein
MTEPMETVHVPLPCQEPEGHGRTHLEEESLGLLIDTEMPMGDEVLHKQRHASCSIPPPHRNRPALLSSWSSLP